MFSSFWRVHVLVGPVPCPNKNTFFKTSKCGSTWQRHGHSHCSHDVPCKPRVKTGDTDMSDISQPVNKPHLTMWWWNWMQYGKFVLCIHQQNCREWHATAVRSKAWACMLCSLHNVLSCKMISHFLIILTIVYFAWSSPSWELDTFFYPLPRPRQQYKTMKFLVVKAASVIATAVTANGAQQAAPDAMRTAVQAEDLAASIQRTDAKMKINQVRY